MSNDAQIKKFRKTVETKRAALGTKPKLGYATNASIMMDGSRINLNTLDEDQCVDLVTRLLAQSHFNSEANKALGTNVKPRVGDFTVTEWIADIKLRVQLLAWESDKKKLNAMDAKLQELMSEGARTADAIADIAAQLED